MTRLKLVLAIAFLTAVNCFHPDAMAQGTYSPQSPTISPWLGLWNNNTGPLDNYHNFVRPQMDLNRAMQTQDLALARQAAGLQSLNAELNQGQGQSSGMMPTGQGGTFMTYSHFFNNSSQTPQSLAPRLAMTKRQTVGNQSYSARPSTSSLNGAGVNGPGFTAPGFQAPSVQH